MNSEKEKIYQCPACEEGFVECVCWDDNDEWECTECNFKIQRGSNLLEMIPALQEAEEKYKEAMLKITELQSVIDEVHNWIVWAAISTPEDMMKNAFRIAEITKTTARSNCYTHNISNTPKE